MTTVSDTRLCDFCGEEYWYNFDTRTGEVSTVSRCKCQHQRHQAVDLLDDIDAVLQSYLTGSLSNPDSTIRNLIEEIDKLQDEWKEDGLL